ncbi:uncharacterized protein EI97DRAFT_212495 [Westerdykella ornata]|uniref:Uncharacterized protein n=1 Tax=Westerdykella ornata TaxID=318751 RepID=A0A6A6J9R2_WESOR|nr:uncharacterized protein EI97DRAFT_212495 [Westerdykella ornata]KAF2272366.1 hypothetical protein EI97DRAFT_212495 [Westerdykella ornata]
MDGVVWLLLSAGDCLERPRQRHAKQSPRPKRWPQPPRTHGRGRRTNPETCFNVREREIWGTYKAGRPWWCSQRADAPSTVCRQLSIYRLPAVCRHVLRAFFFLGFLFLFAFSLP